MHHANALLHELNQLVNAFDAGHVTGCGIDASRSLATLPMHVSAHTHTQTHILCEVLTTHAIHPAQKLQQLQLQQQQLQQQPHKYA